jgi:hypothetical protein
MYNEFEALICAIWLQRKIYPPPSPFISKWAEIDYLFWHLTKDISLKVHSGITFSIRPSLVLKVYCVKWSSAKKILTTQFRYIKLRLMFRGVFFLESCKENFSLAFRENEFSYRGPDSEQYGFGSQLFPNSLMA